LPNYQTPSQLSIRLQFTPKRFLMVVECTDPSARRPRFMNARTTRGAGAAAIGGAWEGGRSLNVLITTKVTLVYLLDIPSHEF